MPRKPQKAEKAPAQSEPNDQGAIGGQAQEVADQPTSVQSDPEPKETAGAGSPEVADEQSQAGKKKAGARTSNGYVDAKLKARHCSGGRCKEKGETVRMTRGEYERLKKHDRVE